MSQSYLHPTSANLENASASASGSACRPTSTQHREVGSKACRILLHSITKFLAKARGVGHPENREDSYNYSNAITRGQHISCITFCVVALSTMPGLVFIQIGKGGLTLSEIVTRRGRVKENRTMYYLLETQHTKSLVCAINGC